LFCSNCPLLTLIPLLPVLDYLNCSYCPLLTAIPVLPILRKLYCSYCPLLTSIPVLPALRFLYCSYCPLLTTIPVFHALRKLDCYNCPWLPQQNPDFNSNIQKLLSLQKAFRSKRFRQRLGRFITLKRHLEFPRVLAGMIAGY
jgi:Leucine-rich repeat (LRR) protein